MDHDDEYVGSFTRPIIGPKVYLSRGPSGLPETFERKLADRELELYLGQVKVNVRIAIDSFIRRMTLERRSEDWGDVIGHLAELTKLDISVPLDVAVSFWAQVDESRKSAAKAAKIKN